MLMLENLLLVNNTALDGPLPANLSWPNLTTL